MKIAQLAPLAESVPPKLYGGTERVVSWLVEELVGLGHDVTLFASGGSTTKAKLVPVWPHARRLSRLRPDPLAPLACLLQAVGEIAEQFDVIHSHLDWIHLPALAGLNTPLITTLHGRLDWPHSNELVNRFAKTDFVSISESQRRPLAQFHWLGTVYHGLPKGLFSISQRSEDHLVFLGRISPEKGPHVAVRIARATGVPLHIAAKIPRGHTLFFKKELEPYIDGKLVKFIGEISEDKKQEFLGKAKALVFPIDWPEPFGLVMIEAMACGTPVIAWNRGSVPEIIEDGVTGFIVESESEAVEAVARLDQLDRRYIRQVFEKRFTSERMAEDYVRLYKVASSLRKRDGTEAPASARPAPITPPAALMSPVGRLIAEIDASARDTNEDTSSALQPNNDFSN